VMFLAESDMEKLEPSVRVNVGLGWMKYPYPEPDACKSLSKSKCPLRKGDKATYHLKMPISQSYPPVELKIEFGLINEKKEVQVCFILKCKVVN
ncbi:hypothetical protein EAI_04092, partial [Harpegnathos saltator]